MITHKVVDIFRKHGFDIWGGKWNIPADIHHFQVPWNLAKILAKINFKHGQKLFALHIQNPDMFKKCDNEKVKNFIDDYQNRTEERNNNIFEDAKKLYSLFIL